MKTSSLRRQLHRCNRDLTQAFRDNLAVDVYHYIYVNLDVMTIDEAISWLSDRSTVRFGISIGETGILNPYRQGKR